MSALLSAALLPTVMLVAWRVQLALAPATGGAASGLFLAFGLASLALAVPFLWRGLPLKRLLAYSSLEHMGILALGMGFVHPLATAGVVLHVAGHALAKSLGFYAAIPLLRAEPGALEPPRPRTRSTVAGGCRGGRDQSRLPERAATLSAVLQRAPDPARWTRGGRDGRGGRRGGAARARVPRSRPCPDRGRGVRPQVAAAAWSPHRAAPRGAHDRGHCRAAGSVGNCVRAAGHRPRAQPDARRSRDRRAGIAVRVAGAGCRRRWRPAGASPACTRPTEALRLVLTRGPHELLLSCRAPDAQRAEPRRPRPCGRVGRA